MITLDVHKERGFSLRWPYTADIGVRTAYVNRVKQTAGFLFDAREKAWVSDGPEAILDLDRYELWPYITVITPQAATRIAKFRADVELILEVKHQNVQGEYGYQKIGAETLATLERALLADDMGLGKSKQALDAINKLNLKRILILAPKSLTWNWHAEIEKWYPDWDAVVVPDGKAGIEEVGKHRITIANHEKIRLDNWPMAMKWDCVVIDEAQKFKNTGTKLWKCAKKFKTERMWALTGTPMEIRVEELYGIMSLLRPSIFGNYLRFREHHLMLDAWGNVIGPRNLELLKDRIAPWMLRRKKQDVLSQLPPKLYNVHYVELSKEERDEYNLIKREFLDWLAEHGKSVNEANALTQLLRLQQFTSSPELLTEDAGEGSKYRDLVEITQEYEGRALVFTRFSQMATRLRLWLNEDLKGEDSGAIITGATNSQQRVERIARFNEGKLGKVFVSTDAGAYGLNVTGADLVVHYDQLWNPGKMWQREDRLHRIGQTNVVNVLTMVCADTIDDGMLKVLAKRSDIFKDIVDGAEDKAISKLGSGAWKKLIEGKL